MQTRPRRVLTAVDFGPASARAIAIAGAIAECCGATLRLLHAEIAEAPPYFTHEQVRALEAQRQSLRTQAEQFLEWFGRENTSHPLSVVVEDHTPVEAILQEAQAADLVVMGTHGRHGPRRWWLGSVAERTLGAVTKPLVIVHADGPDLPPRAVFQRVLVHAAAPLAGAEALSYGRWLAECFGGQIVDARDSDIKPAVVAAEATLLVAAAPLPRDAGWLSSVGEPLVRHCKVPVLFVPEVPPPARP